MAIREDIVASAVQFLQDPNVSSSSVENRIAFLRSKNLTQEEIDAALARSGGGAPPSSAPPPPYPSAPSGPPQPYYQPYPHQNAWQPPPPPPRRDWRDWFIMATVVGGVGYGLYSLGKRYVYPLVAPPTPEKLEQDKKSIEEQFDRAFSLVEQLAQDTEALKKSEQERTERLDSAISDLEVVMKDLKEANRRREDDAQRIRDEVQGLKAAIPKAMENQKNLTDNRLKEINNELTSLKTLVSQRMSTNTPSTPTASSYMRPTSVSTPTPAPPATNGTTATTTGENAGEGSGASTAPEAPKSTLSGFNRSLSSTGGKASIPAWQMAMAKNPAPSSPPATTNGEQKEEAGAGSSSSA